MSDEKPSPDFPVDRRDFVKGCAGAAAPFSILRTFELFEILKAEDFNPPHALDKGKRGANRKGKYVAVIDLDKCDGCEMCTVGCQKAHGLPIGGPFEFMKVVVKEHKRDYTWDDHEAEEDGYYYLPRMCQNCQNAPCWNVCPVGATFYDDFGTVQIDHRACVGCMYCMAACPYDARYVLEHDLEDVSPNDTAQMCGVNPSDAVETDTEVGVESYDELKSGMEQDYTPYKPNPWPTGTVAKCDWCMERLTNGQLPHCAYSCAMGAIYFGRIDKDIAVNHVDSIKISETLAERGGHRFQEELGTEPTVYYLPGNGDEWGVDPENPKNRSIIDPQWSFEERLEEQMSPVTPARAERLEKALHEKEGDA